MPFDTTLAGDGFYDVRITVTDWAGNTATATASTIRVDNSSPDQNPLTLTPLTGTTNQYWDSANSVHYYNPTSAGTFSLTSVPRDVSSPISFVGGNGGANNNSPLTLNVPAGVQAGDLLIAQVGYERTMATSVPTPAGWTRHVDRDNGTIYGQVIFYRWATASEPASYTIPHASGAASISGTLLAYRGVGASRRCWPTTAPSRPGPRSRRRRSQRPPAAVSWSRSTGSGTPPPSRLRSG